MRILSGVFSARSRLFSARDAENNASILRKEFVTVRGVSGVPPTGDPFARQGLTAPPRVAAVQKGSWRKEKTGNGAPTHSVKHWAEARAGM